MLTAFNPEYQQRIPAAFREWRRFLLARISDKAPCDIYGRVCDAHKASNWVTPAELTSSPLVSDPAYGVAFVIVEGDGVVCLDLDKCIAPNGMITGGANAIVARFPGAYSETSISGAGKHVFFRATLPAHRTRFHGGEIYSRRRYILLTGRDASGDAAVDHSAAAGQFIRDFGLEGAGELSEAPAALPSVPAPGSTGQFIADADLIRIAHGEAGTPGVPVPGAGRSKFGSGAHFTDLWTRNEGVLCVAYPEQSPRGFDWSSADAALMMKLSFYTGGDIKRMFRLFKQSALFRPTLSDEDIWRKTGASIGMAISGGRFYDRPVAASAAVPALPAVSSVPPPPAMVLPPMPISRRPFHPRPLIQIPPRQWLYGHHYMRCEATMTIAPGNTGKTAVAVVEALAMVTGRRLLFDAPLQPLRVAYFGEEQLVEIERKFSAAMQHYGLTTTDLNESLYVNSLRHTPFKFATMSREGATINQSHIGELKSFVRDLNVDVVQIDTLKKVHSVNENDNGAMDALLSALIVVAEDCQCSIDLAVHTRKPSNGEKTNTVDSIRGAGSQLDTVRSARLLVRNDDTDDRRVIGFGDAKANMLPPADAIKWMYLQNVHGGNGDNVQVAVIHDITPETTDNHPTELQIQQIINAMDSGMNLMNDKQHTWIGNAIAKTMGIEIDKDMIADRPRRKNMKTVKSILKWMLSTNLIEETTRSGANRVPVGVYRKVIKGTVDY